MDTTYLLSCPEPGKVFNHINFKLLDQENN